MKVLEMKEIHKIFKGNEGKAVVALKDVDLHVKAGETVGIVGESGSGKSTIARLIARIIKPTAGTITLKGHPIPKSNKDLKAYYRHVQMVFQRPLEAFSSKMTIRSYMIQPILNYGLCDRTAMDEKVIDMLKRVGLDESFMDKYPYELSGGQLQRVVIARVLMIAPELIIFDECTSALDVHTERKIIGLIEELKAGKSFSSIFITHNILLARKMCDRIYVMKEGQVMEIITKDSDYEHLYTKQLFDSIMTV